MKGKIRKITLTLGVLMIAWLIKTPILAQSLGTGVGALLDKTGKSAIVNISNGRTAPNAEVVVENAVGEVHAVAELDTRGLFNFSFTTDPQNIGSLYIYAFDELDSTSRVQIVSQLLQNEILPPTIASSSGQLLRSSVILYGFSHPQATVNINIKPISSDLTGGDFTAIANLNTGRWEVGLTGLAPGKYLAVAKASFGGIVSQESKEIPLEIPGIITQTIQSITEPITQAIDKLPEPIKQSADVTSKVLLVPTVFTIWPFLIQLLLGLRNLIYVFTRKRRKWGVVYDALTKHPISGAIVRLYKEGKTLVETEVTGKAGIFSFLPQIGNYTIKVTKPGYTFPSKFVTGLSDSEYQLVYHGEIFKMRSLAEPISLSIPIDALSYRKVALKEALRLFYRKFQTQLETILFGIGFVVSVIAAVYNPIWFNQLILILYIFLFVISAFRWITLVQVWGLVISKDGKPAALITLSLLETTFGRLVQRRVTDESGRYQFIVPKGTYTLLISSPEWELVPTRTSYRGQSLTVVKDEDIVKPRVVVRRKNSQNLEEIKGLK